MECSQSRNRSLYFFMESYTFLANELISLRKSMLADRSLYVLCESAKNQIKRYNALTNPNKHETKFLIQFIFKYDTISCPGCLACPCGRFILDSSTRRQSKASEHIINLITPFQTHTISLFSYSNK